MSANTNWETVIQGFFGSYQNAQIEKCSTISRHSWGAAGRMVACPGHARCRIGRGVELE
jgi:hypothetical protein